MPSAQRMRERPIYPFRNPADEDREDQENHNTDAAHIDLAGRVNAQQGLNELVGLVIGRNQRQDARIDPAHNRPDQPDRQAHRGDNHQSRQKRGPHAGKEARLPGWRWRRVKRCCHSRSEPILQPWIYLGHVVLNDNGYVLVSGPRMRQTA